MKKTIIIILILCVAALGYYGVKTYRHNARYNQPGFAYGNGRLEATEVSVATKLAGKLDAVYCDEGDMVKKDDVLAMMQLNVLNAELAREKAELKRSEAELMQKESKLKFALSEKERYAGLIAKNATTKELAEKAESNYLTADADVAAARAAVEIAKAKVALIQEDINDSRLVSPIRGRVQYRVAEPGEVLSSGDSVLNLVDLTDVYMTFFLPAGVAGKVKIGANARIVLDAAKDTPIPAKITFVSSVAQFTPKTVETPEERQKLMFRIKAKVDPELLDQYIDYVKTGLPGEAWVQLDENAKWPEFLQLKSERK